MKKAVVLLAVVVLVLPAVASAQDNWIARMRVINVSPNDSSSMILDTGTEVAVDSATTVEFDLTYMFNENLGLEVIAAYPSHDLTTAGGALGGADAGKVKVLPPTFTLQYRFGTEGIRPYVGIGLNYTTFPSYDLSADLAALGVTDVDLDDSVGVAGNLGIDFDFGDRWLFNLDVKYIKISTDADLETADGILDTIEVDIDPWVFGAGIGIRF